MEAFGVMGPGSHKPLVLISEQPDSMIVTLPAGPRARLSPAAARKLADRLYEVADTIERPESGRMFCEAPTFDFTVFRATGSEGERFVGKTVDEIAAMTRAAR